MRTTTRGLVLGLLLAAAGPVVGLPEGGSRLVDLAVEDASLAEVIELLRGATGARIAVDPGVARTPVALQVQQTTLDLALRLIAEVADLEVAEQDGGYLLRRSPQAGPRPSQPSGPTWVKLERGQTKKLKLPCRVVAPSVIAGYFGMPGIKVKDGSLKLDRPTELPPVTAHAWLPGPTDAAIRAATKVAAPGIEQRFHDRWSGQPKPGAAHACSSFIPLPEGVRVLIGYDPIKTLIVVGDAAGVDRFQAIAEELDAPQTPVRLEARFVTVATGDLAKLGVTWQSSPATVGQAQLQYAVAGSEALGALPGTWSDGPRLDTVTSQPVVLSVSRALNPAAGAGGCEGVSSEVLQNLGVVLATTDLKLVTWRRGEAQVVLIDPIFGDVVAGLKSGAQAGAVLHSAVPCVAAMAVAQPHESLVVRSITPLGEFRSPDACPLLAELPFVGALYTAGAPAARTAEVLLVLTPRPGA